MRRSRKYQKRSSKNSRSPSHPPEQRRIAEILDKADALRASAARPSPSSTPSSNPPSSTCSATRRQSMGLRRESLKSAFEFTTGKLDSNAAVEGGKYPSSHALVRPPRLMTMRSIARHSYSRATTRMPTIPLSTTKADSTRTSALTSSPSKRVH